ncbi:unnamed protein product [Ectocarpus sp. 4 AP-2014]
MIDCVDELMELDCSDMSVCGNDCTFENSNPRIPSDAIVLPVNNFGANYLQLSVCSKGVSASKLTHFGQVSMERCSEDDFRVCDLAIAPRALTAVAFPPDTTYLRVQQCVLVETAAAATSESDDDGGGQEEEEVWECLEDPVPAEYYGTPYHWPSAVDVDYSAAALCEKDSHCPGSFCSSQQQPRICAPKMEKHFQQSGEHFLDPRWEILDN